MFPCSNFVSLMYSNNLIPTILRPTIVGKTSATLIDHMWTTSSFGNSFNLCESEVILSNITDHYSIFNLFSVGGIVTDERYVEIEKRVITDESKEFLSNRINSWDWECLKNLRSVNEVYDTFIDQFKKLYDESCSVKAVRVKKLDLLKPYITREIIALIKEKHRLQRLFNRRPLTYGNEFRKVRNQVNLVIRNAKANYFKSKLSNNTRNAKETWNVVNAVTGRAGKVELPDQFFIEGNMVSDPKAIANAFNNYFVNIGQSLASNVDHTDNYLRYLTKDIDAVFAFHPVTDAEIIVKIVGSFRSSIPGIDDIPMKLIKENITSLSGIICYVCNLSLRSGIFPKKK